MQYRNGFEVREEVLKEVEYLATLPGSEYKFLCESDGVYTGETTSPNGNICAKAETIVEVSQLALFHFLFHEADQQTEWDILLQESRVIETYDETNHVVYYRFRSFMPDESMNTSDPEIISYRCAEKLTKAGNSIIGFRSVEHEHFPVKPPAIRLNILPSGFVIRSLEPNKCLLAYVQQVELPDNFPSFDPQESLRYMSAMAASHIVNIRRYLTSRNSLLSYPILSLKTLRTTLDYYSEITQANGWTSIFKGSSMEVLSKDVQDGKKILAVKGWFLCYSSSTQVYTSMEQSQLKVDLFLQVWNYGVPMDCCVTRALRTFPNKMQFTGFHSISHSQAPRSPDVHRLEVLPSGFFVHPINDNSSLLTFFMQVENPYQSSEMITQMAPIICARLISGIDALRAAVRGESKLNPFSSDNLLQNLMFLNEGDSDDSWIQVINSVCNKLCEVQEQTTKVDEALLLNNFLRVSTEVKTDETEEETSRQNKKRKYEPRPLLRHVTGPMSWKAPKDNLISSPRGSSKNTFVFLESPPWQQQTAAPVDVLTEELLSYIFGYLKVCELSMVAMVSKRFRSASQAQWLWKRHYELLIPNFLPNSNRTLNSPMKWRDMYIERRRQDNVWFAGEFSQTSMLGHSNSIRTLDLTQHYLISGSSDKLVKVWDRNNIQHCLSTLSGTNSGVLGVSYDEVNDCVRIGHHNGLIKSFKLSTGELVLSKQIGAVADGYHFSNSHVISWDVSVDIWNLDSGNKIRSIGSEGRVSVVIPYSASMKGIIVGSTDKNIRLYNVETSDCLYTLCGHSAGITCLESVSDYAVLSGANDKTAKLWDLRSGKCIRTFKGHVSGLRCISTVDTKVITGSNDCSIRVWDFGYDNSWSCKLEQSSPVLCLKLSQDINTIYSGDSVGELRTYTIQTR